MSMNLLSSFRWVDLFPVAGAAAGSRPTYLMWATTTWAESFHVNLKVILNKAGDLTKCAARWPTLWGNAAGRNRSSPCSCAPPDTRPALRWHTFLSRLWPSQMGTGRSDDEELKMRNWGKPQRGTTFLKMRERKSVPVRVGWWQSPSLISAASSL